MSSKMFRNFLRVVWLLAAFSAGCRQRGEELPPEATPEPFAADPETGEFSVMTYNLHLYCLQDRDGDGQKNDPKAAHERKAAIQVIKDVNPDILAVQEMGEPSVFQEFQTVLKEAGVQYPHTEYLIRGRSDMSLVVLSRYPITARTPHLNDVYSIGEAKMPVARGFLDVVIQINSNYSFRLLVAHLKAKVFHPMGQTEMRRNEARLLAKNIREALKENPGANVMVAGDMNDSFQSAAMREVLGRRGRFMFDLRPADQFGDVWTHFNGEDDSYARIDYLLVNANMLPEINTAKTRAIRHPQAPLASDHRPLLAIIRAADAEIPAGTAEDGDVPEDN